MKNKLFLLTFLSITLFLNAQNLPKSSPNSELEQMVGATEIEIEYSRPGVKDRIIFGGLIPFDKLWRFGANSATTLSTDHSLFFGEKELKAGTYSVFAIPNKQTWDLVFNTDTKASVDEYTNTKDALRVVGNVSENLSTETFTINFDKIKDDSASLIITWANVKVEVPFTVKTNENSIANIEKAIKKGENLGDVYSNSANFYYISLKDNKQALIYVNQSIAIKETFRNMFLKARILKDLEQSKEAIALAEKALKLAEKEGGKGYQNFISSTLEKWNTK